LTAAIGSGSFKHPLGDFGRLDSAGVRGDEQSEAKGDRSAQRCRGIKRGARR
jgi:hypothetical protein